jgi:hypothetical protein
MIFLYFKTSPQRKLKVNSNLPSNATGHAPTKPGTICPGDSDSNDREVASLNTITAPPSTPQENEAKIRKESNIQRSGTIKTKSPIFDNDHCSSTSKSADPCADLEATDGMYIDPQFIVASQKRLSIAKDDLELHSNLMELTRSLVEEKATQSSMSVTASRRKR